MNITVSRVKSDNDSTLSIVYVDSKFQCFGLEDEFRPNKIARETRIPAGSYNVSVKDFGGFHERYKVKFGSWHKGMLHIDNVPEFTDILIHIGNTDDDTAGCLLVGNGCIATDGKISIQQSTDAYIDLYDAVIDSALAGDLTIDFIDLDQ